MDLDAIAGLPQYLQFAAVLGLVVGTLLLQSMGKWLSERNGNAPARQVDLEPLASEVKALEKAVRSQASRISRLEQSDKGQSDRLDGLAKALEIVADDVRSLLEFATNGNGASIKPCACEDCPPTERNTEPTVKVRDDAA